MASVALITLTLGHLLASAVAGRFLTEAHAIASSDALNHDGTVTDAATGLVWQRVVDANVYTQEAAFAYCAGLSLDGGGWRLPLTRELESIVDGEITPRSPSTAFANTFADYLWSSSPAVGVAGSSALAYFVGNSGYFDPSRALRVRCVR